MKNTEVLEAKLSSEDLSGMPDKDLYSLCKIYGNESRKWQRQFAFLLSEVAKRGLHRKYGCESIYYFAAKIGAMGHEVTYRVLALHKKLTDKPLIWNHFRKFGWAKLLVIADLVNVDDQEFWLDKLQRLPRKALSEYIKIFRNRDGGKRGSAFLDENLFSLVAKNTQENANLPIHKREIPGAQNFCNDNFSGEADQDCFKNRKKVYKKMKFYVDNETEFELKKLKQVLEKEGKESCTYGETLASLIKKLKKFEEENESLREMLRNKTKKVDVDRKVRKIKTTKVSRYFPVDIKSLVIGNGKCSFPGCNEAFEELHNPNRFALVKNHENLKPLCRIHHQMIHAGVVDETKGGFLIGKLSETKLKYEQIDSKVRSFWKSE